MPSKMIFGLLLFLMAQQSMPHQSETLPPSRLDDKAAVRDFLSLVLEDMKPGGFAFSGIKAAISQLVVSERYGPDGYSLIAKLPSRLIHTVNFSEGDNLARPHPQSIVLELALETTRGEGKFLDSCYSTRDLRDLLEVYRRRLKFVAGRANVYEVLDGEGYKYSVRTAPDLSIETECLRFISVLYIPE